MWADEIDDIAELEEYTADQLNDELDDLYEDEDYDNTYDDDKY